MLLVVAALAVVLSGCQLRVATDVVVEVDGSGTIALRIVTDQELADTLAEADVDVLDGLDEAASGASWEAVPITPDEGGTGVELRTTFATPEELGERVAGLSSSLAADDGALLRGVELTRTEDGGYAFRAEAGISPPAVVGSLPLDEGPVRFDGDDLALALREGGDELARADLRVTFPTVPTTAEGTVENTAVRWQLPTHELQAVSAQAPPLPVDRSVALLVAGAIGAAVVVAFVVRLLRQRSRSL